MAEKNTRMCVACRARKNKLDLISLCNSNGKLSPCGRNHIGRTMYICNNKECIEFAIKKKVFNKILKKDLNKEFYDNLRSLYNE